jgi:hypothetical protein
MENLVIELIMGWTSVHQNVKDMVELYLRHCLTYHQHHHGLILFQMWPVEVEKSSATADRAHPVTPREHIPIKGRLKSTSAFLNTENIFFFF